MKRLRRINESFGVFNGCEDLAQRIVDTLLKENKKNIWSELIIDNVWFSPTKTIKIIKTNLNVKAAYITNWRKQGLKLPTIAINPIILNNDIGDGFITDSDSKLITTFMHELTHLYEDVMRYRKNSSISNEAERTGYNKTLEYLAKKDSDKELRRIASMLYVLSSFETNALFSQMYGELLYFYAYDIETPEDVFEVLSDTRQYRKMINCISTAKEIIESNGYKSTMYTFYVNMLSNYNFSSFGRLRKWLLIKTRKLQKKMLNRIPKMIHYFLTYDNHRYD
jgi:hypothetical protein